MYTQKNYHFYRNLERQLEREHDQDRRILILREIRDLKQLQLELVRLENEQKEREQNNLRAALERHHQLYKK